MPHRAPIVAPSPDAAGPVLVLAAPRAGSLGPIIHALGPNTGAPVLAAVGELPGPGEWGDLPGRPGRAGERLVPGSVVWIAPDLEPRWQDGALVLSEPTDSKDPPNRLYMNLAQGPASLVVAVLLPTGGPNGLVGLRALRAAGGIAVLGLPMEEREQLSRRARALAAVDMIIPEQSLAREVERVLSQPLWFAPMDQAPGQRDLGRIAQLLGRGWAAQAGGGRPRRLGLAVRRRMLIRGIGDGGGYLNLLEVSQGEREVLLRDLTAPPANPLLPWRRASALGPHLAGFVHTRDGEPQLRVWTPEEDNGELAYCLALLTRSQVPDRQVKVRIMVTGLNQEALDAGRRGSFPRAMLGELPPELATAYFDAHQDHAVALPELREMLVFDRHDLLADPPYPHLDLVADGGRLSALDQPTRAKLWPRLAHSLRPGGGLWLAEPPEPGELAPWFEPAGEEGLFRRTAKPAAPEPREAVALGPTGRRLTMAEPASGQGQEILVHRLTAEKQGLLAANQELSTLNRELVRRNQELVGVNADLENLLRPMGLPLVVVDPHLRIKRFNSSARRLFYLVSSDIGSRLGAISSRLSLPALEGMVRRAIGARQVLNQDVRTRSEVYSLRISPYLDAQGATMGAMLLFMDKTELVRAESQRETIGQVAQLLLDYEDLDDFYHHLPRVLAERLGFPMAWVALHDQAAGEMVLKGWVGLPDDQAPPRRYPLADTPAEQVVGLGQARIFRRYQAAHCPALGGAWARVLVGVPIRVKGGVLGVIGLADVDSHPQADQLLDTLETVGLNVGQGIERRSAQQIIMEATAQALQESQQRYRAIVETANEGVWIVNSQGITVFANPQMSRMLGYRGEEMVGQELYEFLPAAERANARLRWQRRTGGNHETYDQKLLRKDGSEMWAMVSASPMYDEEGRFAGSLGMVADITGRKRAEEQLVEHQGRLQSLAWELTMVEERERRRIASDLHDGVGHLLAAAKINLEMLLDEDAADPEGVRRVLGIMEQAIVTTRSLISDLSPPVLYEMGLSAALEWLAERTKSMTGINTGVELGALPGRISQDAEVVLFRGAAELVNNAVKHSRADKLTIELTAEGPDLVLVVEDNGRGFHPGKAKPQSFGLFSIRERLLTMGGKLELDSRPGQGTRACLVLKLDRIKQEEVNGH